MRIVDIENAKIINGSFFVFAQNFTYGNPFEYNTKILFSFNMRHSYWTIRKCEPVTMRIWHWKSHWKLQPHWKTTETTLKKKFTKDNHTVIFSLITLKFVCYCYPRMLIPYNPTEKFSALLISFVLILSSVTLVFQCNLQCHILLVINDAPSMLLYTTFQAVIIIIFVSNIILLRMRMNRCDSRFFPL